MDGWQHGMNGMEMMSSQSPKLWIILESSGSNNSTRSTTTIKTTHLWIRLHCCSTDLPSICYRVPYNIYKYPVIHPPVLRTSSVQLLRLRRKICSSSVTSSSNPSSVVCRLSHLPLVRLPSNSSRKETYTHFTSPWVRLCTRPRCP